MKTQKEVRDLSYILCPKILSCGDDLNSEYRNGFVNGYLEAQQELFTLEDIEKAIEMARVMVSIEPSRIWAHETHSIIKSLKDNKNEKST